MDNKRTFIAAIVAAVASVTAAVIGLYPLVGTYYEWEMIQLGDCDDIQEDYAESVGEMGAHPLGERCNYKYRNMIAVCWDGKKLKNGDSNGKIADAVNKNWCAYKNVNWAVCKQMPKHANGLVWECTESRPGSWSRIEWKVN